MERSDQITELFKALQLFHSKVGKIKKDAANPFFKSNYASLSNILDSIEQPLQEAGLIFTQLPEGESCLNTILAHAESGQFISSTYCIKPVKNDPQALGSAITYGRRYALGAILGLNIEEDDDGNAASKPAGPAKKSSKGSDAPTKWLNKFKAKGSTEITDAWHEAVKRLANGKTIEDIRKFYKISKANEADLMNEAMLAINTNN